MRAKRKRVSSAGNVIMALAGVGVIVVASSCFTEIPLLGSAISGEEYQRIKEKLLR